MDFINRLLRRSPDSAHIAKERLQLILANDRTHISPETLNLLKDEIIAVISKHIEIDCAHVEVTVSRSQTGSRLVADIPMRSTRSGRSKTQS